MALMFIIYLIIISLFQILGGVLTWIFLKRFKRFRRYALLAEMFLMILVISELTKEGFAVTGLVTLSLIAGFISVFLINKFVPHRHEDRIGRLGYLVFIAMLMHELPEGMAFGSAYAIDASLGIAIAILIGIHNLPEGALVALPYLIKRKVSEAFRALFATQGAFVLGGMITYILLIRLSDAVQAHFMTFAAGMMLFIVLEEGLLLKK